MLYDFQCECGVQFEHFFPDFLKFGESVKGIHCSSLKAKRIPSIVRLGFVAKTYENYALATGSRIKEPGMDRDVKRRKQELEEKRSKKRREIIGSTIQDFDIPLRS